MIDLAKYHGMRFRAKINDIPCEGRISIHRNCLFLCQSTMNGMSAPDKLGFAYSWGVYVFDRCKSIEEVFYSTYVSDFELMDDTTELIENTHFLTV